MNLDDVLGWLKGRSASAAVPQGKTYLAPPRTNYPTSEDVDFARQNDYSYGQPWAPEFNNKSFHLLQGDVNKSFDKNTPFEIETTAHPGVMDVVDRTSAKDVYGKAALASEGSALAKLGFDPNKAAMDMRADPKTNYLLGAYRFGPDDIYANARDPSSLMHESIHRGVRKLSESPYWKPEFNELGSSGTNNEFLIRHLMQTRMGDPEAASPATGKPSEQHRAAKQMFNDAWGSKKYRDLADQMEAAAAQYVAAKRPGGPR